LYLNWWQKRSKPGLRGGWITRGGQKRFALFFIGQKYGKEVAAIKEISRIEKLTSKKRRFEK